MENLFSFLPGFFLVIFIGGKILEKFSNSFIARDLKEDYEEEDYIDLEYEENNQKVQVESNKNSSEEKKEIEKKPFKTHNNNIKRNKNKNENKNKALKLNEKNVLQGIIFSQILEKPRSKKPYKPTYLD